MTLTVFMCALWFIHFFRRHLPSLKRCARSQWGTAFWFTGGTRDPISREVAEMLEHKRLERFTVATKVTCWVGVPFMLMSTYHWLGYFVTDAFAVEQYLFHSE